jgi:hypothetical protein
MLMQRRMLLMGNGSGNTELNLDCPAIAPTAGEDEVSNGEFTTDYTGWTANNATLSVVDSATDPGSASGGSDANCLKVIDAGGAAGALSGNLSGTAETWYQATSRQYSPSSNATMNVASILVGSSSNNSDYVRSPTTTENLWQAITSTFLSSNTANLYVALSTYGTGDNDIGYFDSIHVQPLTFATCLALIGTRTQQAGSYTCYPICAAYTQVGIVIEYKDENNLVMAVISRKTGLATAVLYSKVAGVYTAKTSGNITYSPGDPLKVIVDGTTHTLYYDGTQVGTPQTINNSGLGLDVYGFTPYAANIVGEVVTTKSVNP